MTQSNLIPDDSASPLVWEDFWKHRRRESLLKQSQLLNPERWHMFYDRVAGIWEEMTGLSDRIGPEIAALIMRRRLALPGDSVLDLGCGPGALSLALAPMGIMVTALDNSVGMIGTLQKKIRHQRITGIKTMVMDWKQLPPEPQYDLITACFFPEAYSPEGLRRMESAGTNRCLLVLGDGREAFPLRNEIWEKVMDAPRQNRSFHLICAENYLRAAGRKPTVANLSLPVYLDVDAKRVETYYRQYFAIFGKTGPRLHKAIADTLAPHISRGRIKLSGTVHPVALWWEPPSGRPILSGKNP